MEYPGLYLFFTFSLPFLPSFGLAVPNPDDVTRGYQKVPEGTKSYRILFFRRHPAKLASDEKLTGGKED
jgi:hypothetical protein